MGLPHQAESARGFSLRLLATLQTAAFLVLSPLGIEGHRVRVHYTQLLLTRLTTGLRSTTLKDSTVRKVQAGLGPPQSQCFASGWLTVMGWGFSFFLNAAFYLNRDKRSVM